MQSMDSVRGLSALDGASAERSQTPATAGVRGATLLGAAARSWFVVASAGQWLFVAYIVAFYGLAMVNGDLARWGKFLTHGLMPGDTIGNLALATHLAMAAIITACGPLQLIPQLRVRFPRVHRWTGRLYLVTALAASTSALYLLWIRNERVAGDLVQHLGISIDAALIGVCAAMALRYARRRRFDLHRRWAIRLFLAVSAVWFFRVGLFFWLIVNQGPVGFDPKTFQGPFLDFWSAADSLLPFAVFEVYWRVRERGSRASRALVAGGIFALTGAMGVGIFGAFMNLWLPNL